MPVNVVRGNPVPGDAASEGVLREDAAPGDMVRGDPVPGGAAPINVARGNPVPGDPVRETTIRFAGRSAVRSRSAGRLQTALPFSAAL
jgi:hypothetical protein